MKTSEEKRDLLFDLMCEMEICTDYEIALVTAINGNSLETMEAILFVRTGYRNIQQLCEAFDSDLYSEYY